MLERLINTPNSSVLNGRIKFNVSIVNFWPIFLWWVSAFKRVTVAIKYTLTSQLFGSSIMTHLASHTEVCHILNPSCILAQSLVLPITITVLYSVQYITTITYDLSRVVPLIRQLTPKNRKIMRFSRVWSSKLCFSICSDHCSTVFGLIFVWGKLNSANSMVGWMIGNIWPDSVVSSPVTHPNRPVGKNDS